MLCGIRSKSGDARKRTKTTKQQCCIQSLQDSSYASRWATIVTGYIHTLQHVYTCITYSAFSFNRTANHACLKSHWLIHQVTGYIGNKECNHYTFPMQIHQGLNYRWTLNQLPYTQSELKCDVTGIMLLLEITWYTTEVLKQVDFTNSVTWKYYSFVLTED